MGSMSASDAAPLPRLGEVFFDVRGSSRSMRLSWYSDTGVAVFSIWQGGTCTGTFRLPIDDLPRMVEPLQRGPRGAARPAGESRDQGRGPGAEWQRPGIAAAPADAIPPVASFSDYATGQIAPVTGEFRSLPSAGPSYRDDPLGSGSYPSYRDRGQDSEQGRDLSRGGPGGSFPGYADDGPPVYRDASPPPAYRDDPLGAPSYRDDPLGSGGYRDHSLPGSLPGSRPGSVPGHGDSGSLPGHRDSDPYGGDPLGSGSYPSYRDRDTDRGRDQGGPGGSFPGYADDGPPVYRDASPPPAYRDDPLGAPSYRDDPLGSGGYRDHSLPGSLPGSRPGSVPGHGDSGSLPGHRDSDPYGGDPLGSGSYPSYRDRDTDRGRDQGGPGGSFPGYADDGPPVYRDASPPPAYRDDPLGAPSYRDDPLGSGSYPAYRFPDSPSGESLPGHRDSSPYGEDPLGPGYRGERPPSYGDGQYAPSYRDEPAALYPGDAPGPRYSDDPFQSVYPDDARGLGYPEDEHAGSHPYGPPPGRPEPRAPRGRP